MKRQALTLWEVYVTDPGEVPEEKVRTGVYRCWGEFTLT